MLNGVTEQFCSIYLLSDCVLTCYRSVLLVRSVARPRLPPGEELLSITFAQFKASHCSSASAAVITLACF